MEVFASPNLAAQHTVMVLIPETQFVNTNITPIISLSLFAFSRRPRMNDLSANQQQQPKMEVAVDE